METIAEKIVIKKGEACDDGLGLLGWLRLCGYGERMCSPYPYHWDPRMASNGARFAMPSLDAPFVEIDSGNGFGPVHVTPEAAGLALTTMTINHELAIHQTELLLDRFEKLMDVVYQHPECAQIMSFLD